MLSRQNILSRLTMIVIFRPTLRPPKGASGRLELPGIYLHKATFRDFDRCFRLPLTLFLTPSALHRALDYCQPFWAPMGRKCPLPFPSYLRVMVSVLKGALAAALYALSLPSFQRWIAECVYQRLPKPIHDNFPHYLELFRSLFLRREI